jgi:hypothetical protein
MRITEPAEREVEGEAQMGKTSASMYVKMNGRNRGYEDDAE